MPTGDPRDVVEVPDRVRMPLLTLITQQAIDEDYVDAARARVAGPPSGPRGARGTRGLRGLRDLRGRSGRTVAVVAVFGVLVTVAALQTHRNAGIETESRAALIDRINLGKGVVASQQERVSRLTTGNLAAQRQLSALTDDQQAAALRTRRLAADTGFVGVTGPGVRVTVTPVADADQNQAVRDSDLALLANGLWAAGAEAIAINGQRLTATTAIRTSGMAIYVNEVGIAPPYVVEAIGDVRTLQARFYDTTSGLDFAAIADQAGFDVATDTVNTLSLAAAPDKRRVLRSATPELDTPRTGEGPGS